MELFTCFLENNYELYLGTDTKIKKIQEIPMWFSDKNYASLYNGGKKNVEKINYIPNKIKILDPKDLIVCPKKQKFIK